jgi:signal transduction histidine kinase
MEKNRRKILVVDDHLEFAEMVTKFLEGHEFEASFVLNGNEAIERVSSGSPELILLDLNLPDIPGMEVLKRIKGINEDVAIIIVTGYGGEQVAVDIIKAGALDYLPKPFEFETLLTSIKNTFIIRDAQIEEKRSKKYPSMERFFPFLAHEIRNPLHAIGGALTIIQRRSDLKDELLAQSIKVIQEEVQHLNEFVQECLDFVRPPNKGHFTEVDINELIFTVITMMSHMFEELYHRIRITKEMDPQLPRIYANYDEIKQVFLNILKNSFEAICDRGELVIKTGFKSNPSPGWVEIAFTDNGSGIKKENMENLFKPFFSTKPKGTGLGLPICQRIMVDRHKGEVGVESEEGKGTKVTLRLPVKEEKTEEGYSI